MQKAGKSAIVLNRPVTGTDSRQSCSRALNLCLIPNFSYSRLYVRVFVLLVEPKGPLPVP